MSTRRDFIRLVSLSGGALVLGVRSPFAEAATPAAFRPSAWLRLEPDGSVVLKVGKSEMGQGVRTSLPMLVAEELDVEPASLRLEQAAPGPDFERLGTGGSSSVMGSFEPLRQAGAAARAMLVAAAAARWGVPATACQTSAGVVTHPASQRRAAYGELLAEAARQPVPQAPRLKPPAEHRLLGRGQKRLDGPSIVNGRARFGADVRLERMLHAVVLRPAVRGAQLVQLDAEAARQVRGVLEIVPISSGVAVVAEHTWAALKGRDALKVTWGASPHADFDSAEHLRALERATAEPGITIRKDGRGRAALAQAARRVEALYLYPFAAHAALEPVNSTALVEGRRCRIWSPSQAPNAVQSMAAGLLGIDEADVQVEVTLLGGGFGRRLGVDFDREAVEVARALPGRPVQVLWTREDDMRHGYFQAASAHRLIAGLDQAGRVVAWEHRKASTPHNARRVVTDAQKRDPEVLRGWSWGVANTPYATPAFEASYAVVEAPTLIGPWRSVFSPSSVFARECFVDELAQAMHQDPLALRLDLLGATDAAIPPSFTVGDETVDRRRLRRVLDTVAAKAGWSKGAPPRRSLGLACNVFHTGTYIAYVVEVSIPERPVPGRLPFVVHRVVCALDCGLVVNPSGVAQQVESGVLWSLSNMKNEMTFVKGSAQQSNYHDFPVVMFDETPATIETHLVGTDANEPNGVGEPTVCPLAPAVANALSRLAGRRVRRLPVAAADLAKA